MSPPPRSARRLLHKRLLLAAGGVALAAAAALFWPHSAIAPLYPATPAAAADPATLARGARVVALGDCMVCHTAANGQPYAGGLPLQTPFGTIYSTNITPDRATGIGAWSPAAFERAMRHGVARDGHLLYPAFPYIHYTRMSDADIHAAYAYLQTRAPVAAPAPVNDLIPPLGWRPLLAVWNLLFLRPGNRIADAAQTTPALRGQYLVDSMGHCASCHSGLNLLGGERSPAFGGGHIDGWDAPALTGLSALPVPWTQAELVDYLHGGLSPAHGAAKGPMQPVTAHLAEVPVDEVRAIVAHLNTLQTSGALAASAPPAQRQAPTPPAASAAAQALRQRGATLFEGACASCHGASAPLNAINGRPGLDRSRALTDASPNNFLRTVHDGVARASAPAAIYMPPFAEVLSDADIAALAAYARADLAGLPAWDGGAVVRASAAMRTAN